MAALINILATTATITGSALSFSIFLQAHKIWKNKSSADVSLAMFVLFVANSLAWISYGSILGNFPLIIVNSIALVGAATTILLALKFRK